MFIRSLIFGLTANLLVSTALAEVPKVATDILPVHSLTARVMQGLGEPSLLLPAGANPHAHAMRPSQMRALQEADLVIWVGDALTPWMADTLARVAPKATTMSLLTLDNTTLHDSREEALFANQPESHDHQQAQDAHAHQGVDPHGWLSPTNALLWLTEIAQALGNADPDNAEQYRDNAKTAAAEITAFAASAQDQLATIKDVTILVYHDAYQYFEHSFDLPVSGAIAQSDATKPGAARLGSLRSTIANARSSKTCVVAEPQFNSQLVDAIATEGTRLVELDPIGNRIPQGPDHYLKLLQSMTMGFLSCAE